MTGSFELQPLRSFSRGAALLACLAIAGCSAHSIQTTSGKSYLAKHRAPSSSAELAEPTALGTISFDHALTKVASVEPTLSFPARIGIAKIGCVDGRCGSIAPLHPEEAEAWSEMAASLGPGFGSLVPLHPLALDQALSEAAKAGLDLDQTTVFDKVRLGAARQHLDSVIIYEARSKTDADANLLALGDLTIIGAFVLPSRKIESEAYAAGIILDPISGYPYGQLEAAAAGDGGYTSGVRAKDRKSELARTTEIDAAIALVAEAEDALRDLRLAIAEQKAAP